MNITGRGIWNTTAAVVGISVLGALGSGTAVAAVPTDLGGAPTSHPTSTVDKAGLSSPASSKGNELHTFAMPKKATHVTEPTTRYNDNNDNNSGYQSSSYGNNGSGSSYDNNGSGSSYDNNGDGSSYDNNGYYNNGYRHNDSGLLGGGLLGGNN